MGTVKSRTRHTNQMPIVDHQFDIPKHRTELKLVAFLRFQLQWPANDLLGITCR